MLIANNLFNVTIKFIIRIKQQPSHGGEDEHFLGGRVEESEVKRGTLTGAMLSAIKQYTKNINPRSKDNNILLQWTWKSVSIRG